MIFSEIKNCISDLIKDTKVNFDDFLVYGEKKVDISLVSNSYAISISILSDFTYDCFVVEIKTFQCIKNRTEYHDNIEDLLETLREDITDFISLCN